MIDINLIDEIFGSSKFLSQLQNRLIKILNEKGPMTRAELVDYLNTPRSTIYDNLKKLHIRNVVEKFIRNEGERGRPSVFWKIKE